jgi:hypothetical protein
MLPNVIVTPRERGRKLNEEFFRPLADYLVGDRYDIDALRTAVINKYPWDDTKDFYTARGFLTEKYLQWALSRFNDGSLPLQPSRFTQGKLNGDIKYRVNKWGNIGFFRGDDQITDIDSLYEYQLNSEMIPIVFEVTFGKLRHMGLKRKLVEELYKTAPYICKIRPKQQENEKLGLRKARRSYGVRKLIVIPHRKEIDELAKELTAV